MICTGAPGLTHAGGPVRYVMPARRSLRRAIENCVGFFYNFTLRADRIKTELKLDTSSLSLSLALPRAPRGRVKAFR